MGKGACRACHGIQEKDVNGERKQVSWSGSKGARPREESTEKVLQRGGCGGWKRRVERGGPSRLIAGEERYGTLLGADPIRTCHEKESGESTSRTARGLCLDVLKCKPCRPRGRCIRQAKRYAWRLEPNSLAVYLSLQRCILSPLPITSFLTTFVHMTEAVEMVSGLDQV